MRNAMVNGNGVKIEKIYIKVVKGGVGVGQAIEG